MKVGEAIELLDELKPNQYGKAVKIHWLNTLDMKLLAEVILTHGGSDYRKEDLNEIFYDWTETGTALTAVLNTELLVSEPWAADIYNNYLQSMVDKENAETLKYNNSSAMFNEALREWTDFYTRTHRPLRSRPFRF